MTARDRLIELFLEGEGTQFDFEAALEDYEHELAEKVRNLCCCFHARGYCSCRITPGEAAYEILP